MDERRLPFSEHLAELRTRLFWCIVAYIVAMFVCWGLWRPLFALMVKPLIEAMSKAQLPGKLIAISPTETLWVPMKMSMIAAIFVASPVVFWQLWKFIAPGLYASEKRYVWPFVLSSVVMFVGGAAFCYFVLLPMAYPVLLGMAKGNLMQINELFGFKVNVTVSGTPVTVEPSLTLNHVFDFSVRFLVGCGFIFELPLLISFLSLIGVVTHRSLWRFNRYAIVLSFVVGAILTPGDVVLPTVLVSVPLVMLYNISIVIAYIITRRRERRLAQDVGTSDVPPEAGELQG